MEQQRRNSSVRRSSAQQRLNCERLTKGLPVEVLSRRKTSSRVLASPERVNDGQGPNIRFGIVIDVTKNAPSLLEAAGVKVPLKGQVTTDRIRNLIQAMLMSRGFQRRMPHMYIQEIPQEVFMRHWEYISSLQWAKREYGIGLTALECFAYVG